MPKKTPSMEKKFVATADIGGTSASLTVERGKDYVKITKGKENEKTSPRKRSLRDSAKSDKDETSDVVPVLDIAVLERGDDGKYGWGTFTPAWLQWMCRPEILLLSLMLIAIAQGFFVHGVLSSSFEDLHRRFKFTMKELGLIRMMYDIGMVVAFAPVMYFNAQGIHRAYWLGVSCLVMGIGAMICAMPHFVDFIIDPVGYKPRVKIDTPVCRDNKSYENTEATTSIFNTWTTEASNASYVEDFAWNMFTGSPNMTTTIDPRFQNCRDLTWFKYIFMFGVFLNGVGGAPFFTMGIAFLDEHVTRQSSVKYTGLLNAALLGGAASGYFFTTWSLEFNIDIDKGRNKTDFAPRVSLNYVGAWWIGMIAAAWISVIVSLPMFGFPRSLPGAARAHMRDVKTGEDSGSGLRFAVEHSLWRSMKACLTNLPYLGLVVEECAHLWIVASFSSYMPIYLEAMYYLSGERGRNAAGILACCALVASISGALLQHKLKLTTSGNLRFALASGMATVVCLGVIFVKCPIRHFAGSSTAYPVEGIYTQKPSMTAACNRPELCDTCLYEDLWQHCYEGLDPKTGKKAYYTYFSPCFAGCTSTNSSKDNTTKGAFNCACVPLGNGSFEGGGDLVQHRCKPRCDSAAYAFLIGFAWCIIFIFLRVNPVQQSLLRCISFKDRVVGLTLSAAVSRLFAAMPAPLVMGTILTNSCAIWRTVCKKNATCVWRDVDRLTESLSIGAYIISIMGVAGLALATVRYKEPKGVSKGEAMPKIPVWKSQRTMKSERLIPTSMTESVSDLNVENETQT